jgi:L-ascorbate metabolism protein UlaG (beta-lactamase superfamily)
MDAEEAAELARILRPGVAVPIHYRFTGGPLGDRLILKHERSPDHFLEAVAKRAPGTDGRSLAPGEPLRL